MYHHGRNHRRACSKTVVVCILAVITGCISNTPPPTHSKGSPLPVRKAEERAIEEYRHQDNNNSSPQKGEDPYQSLLDSAMDFYQTANDFWEQGDLDNALDALDKAYSLILSVRPEAEQNILQQKEDLRFTIARRIMEVYASRFNAVNGHQNAIPLVMNKHVEAALKSFTGRERQFFVDAYVRSGKYRPAIVRELSQEGLPVELSWLPLIESGFKVRAMSRARALGMWQFIASTGYKFGLERNEWIDERMDPEKSTRAAIAYLKELHNIFGDWTTALAAYNCGEARVLKAIRRQKINYLDDFWDLYTRLPYETASYVPRFIAVQHILNDPAAYGFDFPPAAEEIAVEKVTIDRQVHLKTIANNIGVSYEELKQINPELRKEVTPKNPYDLNVPAGKAETLMAKLNDLPIYVPPVPPYIVHRVRNGESLSVIATKYRTSVKAIMAMNGLHKSNLIRAGAKLKIPTGSRASYSAVRPPVHTSELKGSLFEYVVQKGDSLWEIANRFNITTRAIQTLNRLDSTRLAVGQVLLIPKPKAPNNTGKTVAYQVKDGDSPYLIAKKHKMNLADFLQLNNLNPRSMIFPGQNLMVRAD